MSRMYVSNQTRVPLPGMVRTNEGCVQTTLGEKAVIPGPTHASTAVKISACMANAFSGFGGAALVLMGSALILKGEGDASLLESLRLPFYRALSVGISGGILSATNKEAAINGALLGSLVQGVLMLSGIR